MSGDESVGDVAGKRVILVDDLISSGGTILRAVDACRRVGARRVDVAVPHGAFGPEAYRLFAENGPDSVLIPDLITVDTRFSPYFEPIAACSRGCTASSRKRFDAGRKVDRYRNSRVCETPLHRDLSGETRESLRRRMPAPRC